jgi:hypothetical protein
MKGVIFTVVEQIVTALFDGDTWDDLLTEAGVHGAYTSVGQYDDAELGAIVHAVARRIGQSPEAVLVLVGRHAFDRLARTAPGLLDQFPTLLALLDGLDHVIHPEVMKLHPGATPPQFTLDASGETPVLRYRSHRGLCRLAEGLVLGAADRFGEQVLVEHRSCTLVGDADCVLALVDPGEAPG